MSTATADTDTSVDEDRGRQQATVGPPCFTPDGVRLRYVPVPPSPKQTAFLALTNREALYGGGGAGGKSWCLLMGALQFADVPGYNALILRRSLTDLKLPDGIISVSKDWLSGTGATYNANDYAWTFPSGAVLQFGYMAQLGSEQRYKSSQFQFIGFDELTEFPWKEQYLYLFSRLRKGKGAGELFGAAPDGLTLDDVPLRVRGATNPGGPGSPWVSERFVDPDTATRPFMPALMGDNPGIDEDEYRASLAELPEVERLRMEEGRWDVSEVPGSLWKFVDIGRAPDSMSILPAESVDVRALAVDPSVSEESKNLDEAGLVMGSLTGGVVTVEADFSGRMHPDVWAARAVTEYHAHGCSRLVVEDNQGGELVVSQVGNAADILGVPRPNVVKVKAKESKEARAAKVRTAYTPGKVRHLVELRSGPLENQMVSWIPGVGKSPDRLDALVWLVRNLLWQEGDGATYRSAPSIRQRMSGRMPGT